MKWSMPFLFIDQSEQQERLKLMGTVVNNNRDVPTTAAELVEVAKIVLSWSLFLKLKPICSHGRVHLNPTLCRLSSLRRSTNLMPKLARAHTGTSTRRQQSNSSKRALKKSASHMTWKTISMWPFNCLGRQATTSRLLIGSKIHPWKRHFNVVELTSFKREKRPGVNKAAS